MPLEPRSAARYLFLRELWEGRDRLVVDTQVEVALAAGRGFAGHADPAVALVDALLGRDGGRVWLLAQEGSTAKAPVLRRGAGLEIVDADAAGVVLDGEGWEVALVDLSGYLGAHAAPSRMLRRDLPGLARRLDRRAIGLLDALADGAARGKAVIVSVAADLCKAGEFQGLVEACFERAHLFGVAPVPMIAIVDFGEIARDDDGRAQGGGDVGIAFDNSLGADAPSFCHYVAVVGPRVVGGLTLLEVPPAPEGPALGEGLRRELAQARRELEAATAGRDALGSQLEAAQARLAALEARPRLTPGPAAAPVTNAREIAPLPREAETLGGERVDVLRATIQTLRWELEKSRGVIGRLAERPLGALEAEVASLRVQLQRATVGRSGGAEPAAERARAALGGVLRRLDRGTSLSPQELRRRLQEIAGLLTGEPGPA